MPAQFRSLLSLLTTPCPVRISDVSRHYGIEVRCENIGTKRIVGLKLRANALDSTLGFLRSIQAYSPKVNIAPGYSDRLKWPLPNDAEENLLDNSDVRLEVWVDKALFDDGTTWSDRGSRSSRCLDL